MNHWKKAVDTHAANHPWAKHLCIDVQFAEPRIIVPGGHLDILVASPSCVFYSRAAGGRPKLDQKRSSPWDILRWLELIEADSLLVENVPELQNWCRVDRKGHPVKSEKGRIYKAWIDAIRSAGYTVEARVLNAADYGAQLQGAGYSCLRERARKPSPGQSRLIPNREQMTNQGGEPREK